MGVKLRKIIIRKQVHFQDLAGRIIAVDAPNIIMSLFNFARKNVDGSYAGLVLDRTQKPISHLYGLLYRINFFYSKNIFPIFCFDGRDSELKKIITKDQLNDFRFTQRWYEQAMANDNKELAKKIALSREFLWQNIIVESKQLLSALGVPYIESPASAESQCAYLVKKGLVNYSNSQDFDSLLFGCPSVVQNLSKSLRRKVQGRWKYQKIILLKINLQKNLDNLGINIFQLVEIGILIGTDYFEGIKGLGSKKALTLISKYRQIEQVIANEKNNYNFSKLTPELLKKVRKIFLFPIVNENIEEIVWNPPDKSNVIAQLCESHFLDRERVVNNLEKVGKNYEKCRNYFLFQEKRPRSIQLTLDQIH
jgi:flap endonuclease-1